MGTYEVLIGDQRAVHWLDVHGGFAPDLVKKYKPVEGGHEADGKPLFIAQARVDGSECPGKIQLGGEGALVAYGGEEVEVKVS